MKFDKARIFNKVIKIKPIPFFLFPVRKTSSMGAKNNFVGDKTFFDSVKIIGSFGCVNFPQGS